MVERPRMGVKAAVVMRRRRRQEGSTMMLGRRNTEKEKIMMKMTMIVTIQQWTLHHDLRYGTGLRAALCAPMLRRG